MTPAEALRRARRLRSRKWRESEKAFLVEGIAPVIAALDAAAPVEAVVVAPALLESAAARDAVEAASDRGADVVEVDARRFESLSERDHPVGLAAIVSTWATALEDLPDTDAPVVLLSAVSNPGNLGTIVRTVDAAGAGGVVVAGASVDFWHPSVVKASMGSLFTVPLARVESGAEAAAWARARGRPVVATSARRGEPLWDKAPEARSLVMFGSEAHGLSDDEVALADVCVRIPIQGSVTSLNLAVAAGIVLFELVRPRPPR